MSRPPHPSHLRTSIASTHTNESKGSPKTPIITISPSSGGSASTYFDQDQHQHQKYESYSNHTSPSEHSQGGIVFHTPVYGAQSDLTAPVIETEAKTEEVPCLPGIRHEFWDLTREDLERRIYKIELDLCEQPENQIENDLARQMDSCGLTRHDKTLLQLNAGAKKTSLQCAADHPDPAKWSIPTESGDPQIVIEQFDKFGVICESVFIVACHHMTERDKYVDFANKLVTSCHTRGSSMDRQLGVIEGKVRAFELREQERRLASGQSQQRERQDSGQSTTSTHLGDMIQEERGRKRTSSYSRWINRYSQDENTSPGSSRDFLSIDTGMDTGSHHAPRTSSSSRYRGFLRSTLDHSRSPSSSIRRRLSGSRHPSERGVKTTSKLVESALNTTKEISEGRSKVDQADVSDVAGLRVLIRALRGH
ncbi:hypothetical protein I302_107102 [Kwoniella bestiolae CBS 10118]|uniref:Uncharacterized protein n=1 Tax=Kwoniella bestiolae CBS 10118 TaxID=1296100 RepID=A0A1B9FZH3_9TREE|nr:hypothetical protein I302_05633 [Kwoniella bestiolae CBS 10118]OCF24174.1 hypothetical protein I302_05633 [Kwoniella bestiolae CBS 10118]